MQDIEARVIVVVGANGSGKTRLGAWLEFDGPQRGNVHRVAAQKSLTIPAEVSPTTLGTAEMMLRYGRADVGFKEDVQKNPVGALVYTKDRRWKGNPITSLLRDYEELLHLLFAEQYDAAVRYREAAKTESGRVPPAETRLDRAKRIWEAVLPHRSLIIGGGKLEATHRDVEAGYPAAEMSDGERVAFYLIGQCLAAHPGAILVIDEPELHLHRAVQSRLWNAIEKERLDCTFVYLTHDLEFGTSRVDAAKVWLRNYENGEWEWTLVPEVEGLPEEILLNVLGSRKPVLFTEGLRGGIEYSLFSFVYPNWTVVPVGGCESVIAATTAFSSLKHLHGLECRGLIDRDFRTEQDAEYLQAKGVYLLPVYEVENLFLLEEIVSAVATHASDSRLIEGDPLTIIWQVKEQILDAFTRDKVRVASAVTANAIERALHHIDAKAQGPQELRDAVEATVRAINVDDIYAGAEQTLDKAVREGAYDMVLRLYGNKGLVRTIGRFFGLPNAAYLDVVRRLITSEKGESMIAALRAAMPVLDNPPPVSGDAGGAVS